MGLWIKICGLTTADAVNAATDAGVDAVGFVFAPSPRQVTPLHAAAIASSVAPHVARVAVMFHPSQDLLDEVVNVFQPDVLQTDAEDFEVLDVPRQLGRLPVYRAGSLMPQQLPVRMLFEGAKSGSGETTDWVQARALARRTQVVLAGGLDARNVANALTAVGPFGIDVSSGVESAPGSKSRERIMEFVAAARAGEVRRVTGEAG